MKTINLIFPNQLFCKSILIDSDHEIYLIEEFLFFKQYSFHKHKIAFHRATMKAYHDFLIQNNKTINYIDSQHVLSDIRNFETEIKSKKITHINIIDPCDNWLLKRIKNITKDIQLTINNNPLFINNDNDLDTFFKPQKKSFFQTSFYKNQRRKLNLLLDNEQQPIGGQWTYDLENRKKYPKDKKPPIIIPPKNCNYWQEAINYTKLYFKDNPGNLDSSKVYPINFKEANDYFDQFLNNRFAFFGDYEDAIVKESSTLHHSILSPLINVGFLNPLEVVNKAISYSEKNNIPINSTEGFVRQIIGWREFIRGVYMCKGSFSRTYNYWGFKKDIPKSFYDGSTGIEPIDYTIKKILKTGYCNHIERLMILGNFMLLCEFHPDSVYKWFMEMFVDSYDWVMVPNVYGMCLYADGGVFATKPYICGSNYIKKMSNYRPGQWCDIWDGLFWRFIAKHASFFQKNPRTNMLLLNFNKMDQTKKQAHLNNAHNFLNKI